jgi:hypothetical protein
MSSFASNGTQVVAVGSARDRPDENAAAAAWLSTDAGASWQQTYVRPLEPSPCPTRASQPTDASSSLSRVYYLEHRYVAFGSVSAPQFDTSCTTDPTAGAGRALVVVSRDGVTWTEADPVAFLPAMTPVTGNLASVIRGVARYRHGFVAVGDLFTGNRGQPAGLHPVIWRSHDALHWSRRLAQLGDGYDPYQDGVVTHDGTLVASGRTDRYPAIAWTSRDVTRWTPNTITPDGGASIIYTSHGYIAFGVIGLARDGKRNTVDAWRPAVWQSDDARHWRRVLRLARGGVSGTDISVCALGRTLVASGNLEGGAGSRAFLYTSTDARTWKPALDAEVFPQGATLGGCSTLPSSVVVTGTVPNGPNASSNMLWTATRA